MAFKGTWHRGDGPGNTTGGGDRRYPSSTDSYTSFSLPPQGVPGNQMGLAPMNYQNNPNAMYPVMNSGPGIMTPSNYSSAAKSLPYTGTISNIYRDFGVIDNEISFKLNTVSGPLPRVGDRVVCQMKPAEGFGTQTPYKYYGFEVRSVQASAEARRAPRPTGSQPMPRTSDSFINRNPNRNQPINIKRSVPNTNNHPNDHQPQQQQQSYGNNRHGSANNGSNNNNDRHRSSPPRRSHSRTTKMLTPKRTSRAPPPKYTCTLPKGNLDCSEFNVIQVRSRYTRLHIPSDFYHVSYTWHQSIPLDRPLKFITPCSFHLFNKNVPRLANNHISVLDAPDADYTWNVRVMLMSSPDIQTLITRSCLINHDPTKKTHLNPDDLEHPSKLIKFLVGVRHQNEYFPLGGCWSEALDGANPDKDPQVLIRTGIRCVHAQTGIDLSQCIQWCRYLEVRYHRPEEIHKGRLIESRIENIVVFLPDIAAACMPSSLEWEDTMAMYKQACQEELTEELNETTISDEDTRRTPSHHSTIELDTIRTIDLKLELKARDQPVTGFKVDLKKRLAKIIQQEKIDEEKPADTSAAKNVEQENGAVPTDTVSSSSMKIDVKEPTPAEIDKLRKEIELKYQLPSHRSILVHPTGVKGDKFDCRVVSLHYLLNYANKDTIKEKCFELYLFSEAFSEMLTRDSSYQIYRSLYSCLEVTETPATTEPDEQKPTPIPEEHFEPMITSGDDVILPGLDLVGDDNDQEENEKKRKRSPSKEDTPSQRKKPTTEDNSTPVPQTRLRTIHPELLLAFTFFDRNRCGYLSEKDLEEILLLSGLSLTKNEAKILVSRIAHNEKIAYHQLTDKVLPIDDNTNGNNQLEINDTDIDPSAPKGNLLLLPQHFTVFGVRTTVSNDADSLVTSIDNPRAMKQLEISNRIQTGLELKIETMKKELNKLTDELHSTQKSNRSYSEQLSETKKRLRDTQHDLKELEDKYKRYSDALYRVRSESRSTVDHLTHVLGIKEKQPSQVRKCDDDAKKTPPMKAEGKPEEKKKEEEEDDNDEEATTKVEENIAADVPVNEQ